MMSRIIRALSSGERALIELPTGSGKSFAMLCGALAWQEHHAAAQQGAGSAFGNDPHKLRPARVIIASRTHSQLKQLVRELRKTSYRPRIVVLGSRDQLCGSKRAQSTARKSGCGLTEACRQAIEESWCHLYRAAARLRQDPDLEPPNIPDIEDVLGAAKAVRACAYFGTRMRMKDAELVLCPYNYILDPLVRASSDLDSVVRGAGVLVDEAHNVEDVARDAASCELQVRALRDAAVALACARTANSDTAMPEEEADLEHLQVLVESFVNWAETKASTLTSTGFEREARTWSVPELRTELASIGLRPETAGLVLESWQRVRDRAPQHAASNEADYTGESGDATNSVVTASKELLSRGAMGTLSSLMTTIGFMFGWSPCIKETSHVPSAASETPDACIAGRSVHGMCSLQHYSLALVRSIGAEAGVRRSAGSVGAENGLKLALWCHHAELAFAQVRTWARSVVLTSGTLSPLRSLESELGTSFPLQLEAGHVVPPERVCALTLGRGMTNGRSLVADYQHGESLAFQDSLGELMEKLCSVVPGGVLAFFTSYSTLDKLRERWTHTRQLAAIERCKRVFVEPRRSDELAPALADFYSAVSSQSSMTAGALMLAVFRGKVSEGLDFRDANCRAVIAVGLPFPHARDLRVRLKREHNDRCKRLATVPHTSDAGSGVAPGGFLPQEHAAPHGCPAWLSGSDWYCHQAHRALNQAVGRCMRHRDDFGAIVLVDDRFQRDAGRIMPSLSTWLRKRIEHAPSAESALGTLDAFFRRMALEPCPSAQAPTAAPRGSGVIAGGKRNILREPSEPTLAGALVGVTACGDGRPVESSTPLHAQARLFAPASRTALAPGSTVASGSALADVPPASANLAPPYSSVAEVNVGAGESGSRVGATSNRQGQARQVRWQSESQQTCTGTAQYAGGDGDDDSDFETKAVEVRRRARPRPAKPKDKAHNLPLRHNLVQR